MSLSAAVQARIAFQYLNVDDAIAIAKQTGKLVFVDTYASWCGPCKVMDKVFDESQVGAYFNQHFINVKVDMEGHQGDLMLSKYEVVWLPTLLIIDGDGQVLTKIDYLMSSDELISAAQEARSGYASAPVTSLESNPFGQGQEAIAVDYNPEEKERIIFVHDDKTSSGRPHMMFHEAYLHFQLKDGRHMEVVRKYLSTQTDWSTEKNIKFIFDFLQNVKSPEFEYFIENKARFEEVVGKERVDQSLYFIIQQRLEKGVPRPSLQETQRLYNYLDPATAADRSYKYYLRRLLAEQKYDDYVRIAPTYLKNINPYDHFHINEYVKLAIDRSGSEVLRQCEEQQSMALSLEDDNPDYRLTMSKLYYKLGLKDMAIKYIDQAIALSRAEDDRRTTLTLFKQRILQGL